MKFRLAIAAALLALMSLGSFAHGPERGPNGGQMQEIGSTHLELVIQNNELTVYITDQNNQPVSLNGATGTATVLAGGASETVQLQPLGGNVLRGRGNFTAARGMRVVVLLTLQGQRAQQARFTPMD